MKPTGTRPPYPPHPLRRRFRAALYRQGLSMTQWALGQGVRCPTVSQVLSGHGASARLHAAISAYARKYDRLARTG